MRQAVGIEGQEKPLAPKRLRARAVGRDPAPRRALWPAAMRAAPNRSNTWPHQPKLAASRKLLPTESRPHMAQSGPVGRYRWCLL